MKQLNQPVNCLNKIFRATRIQNPAPARFGAICLVALCLSVFALVGRAQSAWVSSPASAYWNNAANWNPSAVPGTGSNLVFATSSITTLTNDVTVGTSFGTITFNQGANNFTIYGNAIGLSGTISNNSATTTIKLPIVLSTTPSISAGNTLNLGGVVSGNYGFTVASGFVSFGNTNTYTGPTTVANWASIGLSGNNNYTLPYGNSLTIGGPNGSVTEWGWATALDSLSGSGSLILQYGASLTVGVSNSSSTFSGPITVANGTSTLTKAGTGTQILSGTNSYNGTTTITGGALLINGNSSAVTNTWTVQSGATLGGTNTIGGKIIVNNGGIIQPTLTGNVGTLTLTNTATFTATGTLKIRIPTSTTADQVALSSTASTATFDQTKLNLVIDTTGLNNASVNTPLTIVSTAYATGINTANTFASVTANNGYVPIVTYNANSITVTMGSPKAITTTTLTSSANPSTYGVPLTFTATVQTNGVTVTAVTSNVVFQVDGSPVATNAVSSGQATYLTSSLINGTHTITATYLGDANYSTSTTNLTQTNNMTAKVTYAGNPDYNAWPYDVKYWRSPSIAKAMDLDGDNVWGTAGYVLFATGNNYTNAYTAYYYPWASYGNNILNTPGTLVNLPAGMSLTNGWNGPSGVVGAPWLITMQDPANTNNLIEIGQAFRDVGGTNGSGQAWLMTMGRNTPGVGNPNAKMRISVLFYMGGTGSGNDTSGAQSVRLLTTSSDSGYVSVPFATWNPGLMFFDVTNYNAGDTVEIWLSGTNQPASIDGVLFDIINPATTTTTLSSSVNPSTYGGSVTFTATVQTNGVTAANATSNVVFQVDGTPVATNNVASGQATYSTSSLTATTHTITATYQGTVYYLSSTANLTQTVNKATPTVTVTVGSYTYSGSAQGPNAVVTSTTDSGAVTWSYVGTGGTTYTASSTRPTSAGTYTATATVAADGNNNSASSSATAFTIGKNSPTVMVTVSSYTYTGSAQGPNGIATISPADSGAVTWSYVGTGGTTYTASSTRPTSAGTYTATATVAADANNNQVSSSATAFTIGQKASSVTANAQTKTYGDVNPTLTATVAGMVGSDTLNYTLATTATQFSSVGLSNITVTLGSNPNYSVLTTNSTLTISAKAASVTADAKSKTYGDVNPTLTATVVGTINGDTLSYTLATDATQFSSVGTSNIMVSLGSNPNYNVSATNSTLTINQASTSVGAASSENPAGYHDSVTYTATLPANATGNVVFSSTNGPISTNALSSGSSTSLSITNLPRGTNVITVAYLGDSNYLASSNSLNQIVTNHPPVANAASYMRLAVLDTIKIAVTNLLIHATDVDGDTLFLTSVSATTNNAILQVSNGWVMYYNTNAVNDQFTYTVSDGFGGTNSATVTINVDSSPLFGQSALASTTGGTAILNFAGIPGYSYSVSRSTNLVDWAAIWTTNAPISGVFQYIDLSAPQPSAYYRLQFNP